MIDSFIEGLQKIKDHWELFAWFITAITLLAWKIKAQLVGKAVAEKLAGVDRHEAKELAKDLQSFNPDTPVTVGVSQAIQKVDPRQPNPEKSLAEKIYEKIPILGKIE